MKTSFRFGALMCAFASSFILLPSAFPQGSLTPPGVPTPTMKSLDQIRSTGIPLNATNTLGDANYEFVINQAGSYYLTGNLNVTKPNGIHVTVAGVTVDLNGFQISRSSGASGEGISIDSTAHHCTVENGSITTFANGIRVAALGGFARGCAFRDLSMSGCTNSGIIAGDGAVLDSCRVHDSSSGVGVGSISTGSACTLRNCTVTYATAGTYAIFASSTCSLTNCTAFGNTVQHAIYAGVGSTLTNCTADFNNSDQSISDGFITDQGCTLTNCAAYQNVSTAGIVTGTTGAGFLLANGCQIRGCTAQFNNGDGFNLSLGATTGERSTITDCTAANNGGNGISTGEGSTLTNCTADSNGGQYGIFADDGSTITNCTARANTSVLATSSGIHAEPGSTVRGCTSTNNTNTNASPGPLTGIGIEAFNGSTIKDCTATANKGDGIHVPNDSLVVGNTCDSNGLGAGDGAGIHATSSDNRIEGNNVTDNDRGIDVDSAGNVIIKNSASGNTTNNYDIVANNVYGAIVDRTAPASAAVTGNSGPASAGTTDPWANIAY